ncbi:MAG: hypothetical protein ABI813_14690 [Bacteroidota bacterium]
MKTFKNLLLILSVIFLFVACQKGNDARTLVLIDRSDPNSKFATEYLIPYLDHFGITYDILDIHEKNIPARENDYALIILAHPMVNSHLADPIIAKIRKLGAGLVSFDPGWNGVATSEIIPLDSKGFITFNTNHFITSLHDQSDTVQCFQSFPIATVSVEKSVPLVFKNGRPLLLVTETNGNRVAVFTSMEWMQTKFLGPLMGLDDCLWRSFVWAARKPFVMRGLPPIVTMRVDDVAGRGEIWQKDPLYWINTCNKYQLKPWLSLFIYNLNPKAVTELRGYIQSGQATASPHAFGRPPRNTGEKANNHSYSNNETGYLNIPFYYNPKSLPLRETEYDEFIYFDHQHFKPWSDEEAKRGLDAVDQWYEDNKPLPKSIYLLPHWYEVGANVIEHVARNWQIEFIGQNKAIDMPWNDSIPWIKQGPFRLHEEPGTSTNNPSRKLRGTNPVYYADFTEISGQRFFSCLTEIRDNAGYEWAPDNNIEATVNRGINQLSRALNSMALPVLFTHETDFIYKIKPENWDREIQLVTEGIKSYNPIYLTMDEALKIVRATKTSKLGKIETDKSNDNLKIELTGKTDVKSYLYVFSDRKGKIDQQLVEIPAFDASTEVTVK